MPHIDFFGMVLPSSLAVVMVSIVLIIAGLWVLWKRHDRLAFLMFCSAGLGILVTISVQDHETTLASLPSPSVVGDEVRLWLLAWYRYISWVACVLLGIALFIPLRMYQRPSQTRNGGAMTLGSYSLYLLSYANAGMNHPYVAYGLLIASGCLGVASIVFFILGRHEPQQVPGPQD